MSTTADRGMSEEEIVEELQRLNVRLEAVTGKLVETVRDLRAKVRAADQASKKMINILDEPL